MNLLMKKTIFASYVALFANAFLLLIKTIAAYLSGSIALASDAVNSFTDVISSIAIFFAVKSSGKRADENYNYGHKRAEPLAGIMVAIFGSVLGLEVLRNALFGFLNPKEIIIQNFAVFVVAITIILKFFLYIYFRFMFIKHKRHPSLSALSIDSRNDMFISFLVLAGFLFYNLNFHYADNIAGLLIGFWIIGSSLQIGITNSDYLMGKRPPEDVINHIREKAISVEGVKGLNDVFAQYIGPYIHTEVHIELEKNLKVPEAHDIGKKVQRKLERSELIDRAFIHIDPYIKKKRFKLD